MTSEQSLPQAVASCSEPASEVASVTTAKTKSCTTPLVNGTAQEHENPTITAQSPGVTPDVRLQLEALLVKLERWGKIQEECTTEISNILRGSPGASDILHNHLPKTTIPGIRTASSKEFHKLRDSTEPQYTIDALGDDTAPIADEPSVLNGVRIPERIRINSARVIYTIKRNFFAIETEYSSPVTRPLIILRPFKCLVHYEQHIKRLLGELEADLDAATVPMTTAGFETFMARKTSLKDHKNSLNIASLEDFVLYTKELRCLVDFMDDLIQPARTRIKNETDIVSFPELWFLFPECSYIFAKGFGLAQKVWRIIQRTGGRREMTSKQRWPSPHRYTNFVIDCYFVDYNGSRFLPVYGRFEIEPFEGRKAVTSLPVVPLRVAAKDGLVDQDAITRRGELFVQYCTKPCHLYYNGWSHHRDPKGMLLKRHLNTKIDSEVILDFKRAVAEEPSPDGLEELEPAIYKVLGDELSDERFEFDDDANWDKLLSNEVISNMRVPDRDGNLGGCRDCMPIFPDRVLGYVLRTRTWASLRVGKTPDGQTPLQAIHSDPDAWDRLYLPLEHKKMLRALVFNHFQRAGDVTEAEEHPDIQRGKGQGVIVHLYGAPGTGKTSTAECVAATSCRPLLRISCSHIGNPEDVEAMLTKLFHLAHGWGCVLLMDEADMFLASRSKAELSRNALVSILLRALEYYPGLLFLTTNRVGSIDEAFRSRIHISLLYPPIDKEGTLKIWRNNIARISRERPQMRMDEQALIHYAAELYQHQRDRNSTWDGRQVTNAFQSAVALAAFNAPSHGQPELTTAHFQQVCETSIKFDEFLFRVQGETINDLTTGQHNRPGNDQGRDRITVTPSRSGLDSPSDSEQSTDANSSASESPALNRGHASRNYYNPSAPEPSLPSPAAPLQPSGQHQPPHSPAFPFQVTAPPQNNPSSWPAQMQQPVVVPAGILYALQSQQPWPMLMSSLAQQQSQSSIPGTAPHMPTLSSNSGYDQGQMPTSPHSMPFQPVQQQGNNLNIPNSGSTFHPPSFNHVVPSFHQQHYQSDAPPSSPHSADAIRSGKSKKKRHRESRRPGSHMDQGGRQTKQLGTEDEESFWSRLKKDF